MKSRILALAVVAAITVTPILSACGSSQGGDGGPASGSPSSQVAAPVLDGRWRQVNHDEGDDGMIGIVDGDMIELLIGSDGTDWVYWCGTFEAPTSNGSYTFTSIADEVNKRGLLASLDDTKEFTYKDGHLIFEFTMRGETVEVVMEQVSEEAGLLAEVKSGEGKPAPKDADIKNLELVDYNYVLSNGYVKYVLAIHNPNEEFAPKFTNVKVVGRSPSGTITFSDDWTVGITLPGATTYWASQAGGGDVSEEDTIEISVSVDEDNWVKTSLKDNFYAIDNASIATDKYDRFVVTGEITLLEDVDLPGTQDAKSPSIICVLKDADGGLVAGFNTYTSGDLIVGEPSAFEIDSMFEAVDFENAQVYANPW